MSFPAGWYDDPQDPTQQRYWDGSAWTDQRRGQQNQTPPGTPQYGAPAQHGQVYGQPTQPTYGQPTQQYGQPAQHGQVYGQPQYQGQPQQYQGQPQYQQPYQPQQPYYGQGYQQQGYGYPGQNKHVTPDGQPLSGWWRRVFAYIIDSIIVGIIGLPLTGYFIYRYTQVIWSYLQDTMDQAAAGTSTTTTTLPAEAYKWIIPATLISIAVGMTYQVLFLTKKGATPGKMALGIAVRLRDVPGNPPASAVFKRYGFEVGLGLLASIPLVGTLFGFLALINYLWPLWDDKKQALHDKVAGTNVVRR